MTTWEQADRARDLVSKELEGSEAHAFGVEETKVLGKSKYSVVVYVSDKKYVKPPFLQIYHCKTKTIRVPVIFKVSEKFSPD